MKILLASLNLNVAVAAAGTTDFSIKVPGTFNGVDNTKSGRFLKRVEIQASASTDGDRVYDLRIEDDDGILAAISQSTKFENYPRLFEFTDMDISETADLKRGLAIPPNGLAISKIDPESTFDFIPSGFYLKGTIANGSALVGKNFKINVFWGRGQ